MKQFLMFAAALCLCNSAYGENLVVDPDMEAKDTQAWVLNHSTFTEGAALIGSFGCEVEPGIVDAGISQTVHVQTGTEYIALAWIRMGEWGELGWFRITQPGAEDIEQAITHKGWLLYAIPFVSKAEQVTLSWAMDSNTGGSRCDMFALTPFENLLADPGIEDGGADVVNFGGWSWGAWATGDGPRTGDVAWISDAGGGGGWGFYPAFAEGDLIIAGAWIKTGEYDIYEPGFIDRTTWSNMGWWAVRKKEHECEINIAYSDIDYYQYVIPYQIPAIATSPEILWWQSWGQNASFCDDLFLIMSPYTDSQIPWELIKSDPDSNWGFWPNPEDAEWPTAGEVGVDYRDTASPRSFALVRNFPNPFNSSTQITYQLDRPQWINLSVFAASGAEVAVLADGDQEAGGHRVLFDAAGLPSGVYVCRLRTPDAASTLKMLFVQ